MPKLAYWRGPGGTQHTKSRYAPSSIFDQYSTTAKVTKEGGLSWVNQDIVTLKDSMLPYMIVLDQERKILNENDTWAIFRKSLQELVVESGGGKSISSDEILKRAEIQATTYFTKPCIKFTLVASISIPRPSTQAINYDSRRLAFPAKRHSKFTYPQRLLKNIKEKSPYWRHIHSSQYQPVYIHVRSRTPHQAFEDAREILGLYRALLNLRLTRGLITHHWKSGPHRPQPLSLVHSGPVVTLHQRGGGDVGDGIYSYEPDFAGDYDIPKNKKWDSIYEDSRELLRKIAKLKYRHTVSRMLIRYAEALDNHDFNISCLQLWQVLEQISGTINYEELIERISWTYDNRSIVRGFLGAVRSSRNSYVHGLGSQEGARQLAWIAKSFAEDHLLSLIENEFGIDELSDYASILSLPRDGSLISKRSMLYSNVAKALKV